MAGELGSIKISFVDIVGALQSGAIPSGTLRLWADDSAGTNLMVTNITQVPTPVVTATQYLWDYFTNGSGSVIPIFSVVRLIQGGGLDGQIALSDNDEISMDTFLGITIEEIGIGQPGKVVYSGKVEGAVAGRGFPSRTQIYMSNIPGQFTETLPDFNTSTVFRLGFTRGDDLYLRPEEVSDLG